MGYKNPKELLIAATKLPAAIEGKLPEGAPKISTMLVNATGKLPDLPDFPAELPDLPAIPELPEFPGLPTLGRPSVEVKPAKATSSALTQEIIPSPAVGVLPEVTTRRGL